MEYSKKRERFYNKFDIKNFDVFVTPAHPKYKDASIIDFNHPSANGLMEIIKEDNLLGNVFEYHKGCSVTTKLL